MYITIYLHNVQTHFKHYVNKHINYHTINIFECLKQVYNHVSNMVSTQCLKYVVYIVENSS